MAKKVVRKEKINLEIPAYVLGILSIIQAFFNPLSAVVIGIVGLVLSKKQKTPLSIQSQKLNIIGLVLGVVFFALVLIFSSVISQQMIGI